MCVYVCVYVCAHMKMFMTFHNGFMYFCCISDIYIYIYIYLSYHESSRTPQHSEWNCLGTDRPQHVHMYGHCVWLNFEHTKNSNRSKKKFPRRRKSNSNLPINSKIPRNRSNWFGREWYLPKSQNQNNLYVHTKLAQCTPNPCHLEADQVLLSRFTVHDS